MSKDACASCPVNYVFEDKSGVISCILNTKANCLEVNPQPNYNCIKCANFYYVNEDGNCTRTTKTISNCIVYAGPDTC